LHSDLFQLRGGDSKGWTKHDWADGYIYSYT
jgi:hypothetical protein